MISFRTKKTQAKYDKYLKEKFDFRCICCLQDMKIAEYKHWVLLKNKFPYDAVYKNHNMLVVKRHIKTLSEQTPEEQAEFNKIVDEKKDEAKHQLLMLNAEVRRTIPEHLHFHLVDYLT